MCFGAAGTDGPGYFLGRIVVMGNDGTRFSNLTMSSTTSGQASVDVTSDDSHVYLVVVSVPEMFTSYQHYPYKVRISMGE